MLFIAIMISICHFYKSWDIPWLFVVISTGTFFGILTKWTIEREKSQNEYIQGSSRDRDDYIHYLTPPLYCSFLLCSLSLFIEFEGFWSWTLVFLLCVFIGFTVLTILFSWGLNGFSKLKINIYGIFGFMLIIFMATMMHRNASLSYSEGYIQIGNSVYNSSKYFSDGPKADEIDTLNRLYECDSNPMIIDFKHIENLNKTIDFVYEYRKANQVSRRNWFDKMRRDWFITGIAFNPSLPWFFIIFTTIIFWISLLLISIGKIKNKEKIDIRHIISIYLTYLLFSLSLSLNSTGFWIWTGIFILCISIGIGLPFLLIRKIKSKEKI